ncbi:MAG: hypothetical protein Q9210_002060, partial [Variospora velana]
MPPHTPPRGAMAAMAPPDTPQLTDEEGSSDELQLEDVEGVFDMDEGEEIGEENGEEKEEEEEEEEEDGLDLERYVVFAGLRRSGYIVVRAPGWYEGEEEQAVSAVHVQEQQQQQQQKRRPEEKEDGGRTGGGVWHWLYRNFLERKPQEPPPLGPL